MERLFFFFLSSKVCYFRGFSFYILLSRFIGISNTWLNLFLFHSFSIGMVWFACQCRWFFQFMVPTPLKTCCSIF